jgi:elongation factor G
MHYRVSVNKLIVKIAVLLVSLFIFMEIQRNITYHSAFVFSGVEAQTLTVWRQADRYHIPRIVFVNKMDKASADFQASVESVASKLSVAALPVQLPLGVGSSFAGVVDLINMTKLTWDRSKTLSDGQEFSVERLSESGEDADLYKDAISARNHLIEQLIDLDADLADSFLSVDDVSKIPLADLLAALRRITLRQQAVPVFCGSSLRNCAVQPLLDGIVDLLPDPVERLQQVHPSIAHYGEELCALAFKTVHDKQRGPLTFVRLYTGSLSAGSTVYNVGRGCSEQIGRLYQVYADEQRDISRITAGNIAAVAGLKQVTDVYVYVKILI